ncbi:hypothetical protein ABPG72_020489, partial [Tetrahymena utriculariae]
MLIFNSRHQSKNIEILSNQACLTFLKDISNQLYDGSELKCYYFSRFYKKRIQNTKQYPQEGQGIQKKPNKSQLFEKSYGNMNFKKKREIIKQVKGKKSLKMYALQWNRKFAKKMIQGLAIPFQNLCFRLLKVTNRVINQYKRYIINEFEMMKKDKIPFTNYLYGDQIKAQNKLNFSQKVIEQNRQPLYIKNQKGKQDEIKQKLLGGSGKQQKYTGLLPDKEQKQSQDLNFIEEYSQKTEEQLKSNQLEYLPSDQTIPKKLKNITKLSKMNQLNRENEISEIKEDKQQTQIIESQKMIISLIDQLLEKYNKENQKIDQTSIKQIQFEGIFVEESKQNSFQFEQDGFFRFYEENSVSQNNKIEKQKQFQDEIQLDQLKTQNIKRRNLNEKDEYNKKYNSDQFEFFNQINDPQNEKEIIQQIKILSEYITDLSLFNVSPITFMTSDMSEINTLTFNLRIKDGAQYAEMLMKSIQNHKNITSLSFYQNKFSKNKFIEEE